MMFLYMLKPFGDVGFMYMVWRKELSLLPLLMLSRTMNLHRACMQNWPNGQLGGSIRCAVYPPGQRSTKYLLLKIELN